VPTWALGVLRYFGQVVTISFFEFINLTLLYLILVPILGGVLATIASDRRSSLAVIQQGIISGSTGDSVDLGRTTQLLLEERM